MTAWRLIQRGLSYHWRIHLAVALGVMAGTAVLTGALLVGDSMRGSLRDLALDGLGRVEEALMAPHFFRQELASEIAEQPEFSGHFAEAVPAIIMRVSLQRNDAGGRGEERSFSGRVTLYAVDEPFWQLGHGGPERAPQADGPSDEIVLNEPLGRELGAVVGDEVLLRLPEATLVPRESTLGRKSGFVKEQPFKVVEIIPPRGLGRFGLQPNQQLPLNAYAPLRTVQRLLGQRGKANALLIAGGEEPAGVPSGDMESRLQESLRPRLADYGVRVELVERDGGSYFNLTTDRMLFEEPLEQAALETFAARGAQPALTYLANYIAAGPPLTAQQIAKLKPEDQWPNAIPYSTVTALAFADAHSQRPGWLSTLGGRNENIERLAEDEIALNAWTLDDLNGQLRQNGQPALKPGDQIRLTFFEPEHPDGKSAERTVPFRLRGVFPLTDAHPANDHEFTPTVRGVTDRASIDDWDAPFEYHQDRVRKADDDYWEDYRATPKAFVSLATGQRLWGTRRFGQVTSIRVPAGDGLTAESLAAELAGRIDPKEMGFVIRPVKAQALAAATGTTPFSVLFLSFSTFIIAAAVMLVAILFRLGVERRAAEIGTLLAAGFPPRRVRRLLAIEGLIVAAAGGLLGTLAGTAYAALMLYGLRTWWVDAVSTPFLELHATWPSFVLGYATGVIVCFAAVWWTLWRMRRLAVRRLLAGQASEEIGLGSARPRISRWIALGFLVVAPRWSSRPQPWAAWPRPAPSLAPASPCWSDCSSERGACCAPGPRAA